MHVHVHVHLLWKVPEGFAVEPLVRRRPVEVVPTRFHRGEKMGNFRLMLEDVAIRSTGVCMFNDNTRQWELAGLHPSRPQEAGGGNAAARPWECSGDAIGMPTGPFRSLDELHEVQLSRDAARQPHTAKEIIDEAFARTVALFVARPEKETLYFSVNRDDPPGSTRIGLAIFAGAVGADVADYISERIQAVPAAVAARIAASAAVAAASAVVSRAQDGSEHLLPAPPPARRGGVRCASPGSSIRDRSLTETWNGAWQHVRARHSCRTLAA